MRQKSARFKEFYPPIGDVQPCRILANRAIIGRILHMDRNRGFYGDFLLLEKGYGRRRSPIQAYFPLTAAWGKRGMSGGENGAGQKRIFSPLINSIQVSDQVVYQILSQVIAYCAKVSGSVNGTKARGILLSDPNAPSLWFFRWSESRNNGPLAGYQVYPTPCCGTCYMPRQPPSDPPAYRDIPLR
jgi:hypothetical protein